MTGLLQDIRYALRQMRKSPGFAAAVITVLALGLGATTGMLAIVRSVLVRSLDYRDADRLVLVGTSDQANTSSDVSYPDFQEMRRNLHLFQQIGAYISVPLAVQTSDGAQMLVAPAVTANLFDMLGIRPLLGRSFRQEDESAAAGTAIVSYEFWQHSLHGRPDILGSTLRVNGEPQTIVGVMPPHFQFPQQTETIWITLQINSDQKSRQGFDTFSVLGRLKPGITLDQARSEGEAFMAHRTGSAGATPHFWLYPYQHLVTANERPSLLALLAACLVLLVIAVMNAANLQVARAVRREGEIAMRAALGATRTRLARQLLIESMVLSVAGAGLGWLISIAFVQAARRLFSNYPRFDELRLDSGTFAACILLAMACGVAAALAPAWHVLIRNRSLGLQQSATAHASRPHRINGLLVMAEVALTSILLISAGLLLRTFRSLQNVPLGFDSDHVTAFVLWPVTGNVPLPTAQSAYQRILDRLQHTPGIQSAGMVTSLPVSNFQITLSGGFTIPGHPLPAGRNTPQIWLTAASPTYFQAMHIPIVAGRSLSDSDIQSNQLVGVVNQTFVRRCLPGVDPLGKQIVLDKDAEFPQPITIVGVSGDTVQRNDIGGPIEPQVAMSFRQVPDSSVLTHYLVAVAASFAVRSRGDLSVSAQQIRDVVKNEAPGFAIDNLAPLSGAVQQTLRTQQLAMQITSAFAWIALLLSAAGLYGVLAYLVGQRVREIGIRLALGATRKDVFALVVKRGSLLVGFGLGLGWVGSALTARWIRSFLFGTSEHDPLTYLLAGAIVILASAIAIMLPARRAALIEPMEALRTE